MRDLNRSSPPLRTDLAITTTWCGRRAVVAVAGEIDLATAPQLEAAIAAALEAGALQLWVDLGDVGFMDSTGVNLLLNLKHRAAALSRRLAIVCGVGAARRTLEVTGLVHSLPLFADRAEAHRRS